MKKYIFLTYKWDVLNKEILKIENITFLMKGSVLKTLIETY